MERVKVVSRKAAEQELLESYRIEHDRKPAVTRQRAEARTLTAAQRWPSVSGARGGGSVGLGSSGTSGPSSLLLLLEPGSDVLAAEADMEAARRTAVGLVEVSADEWREVDEDGTEQAAAAAAGWSKVVGVGGGCWSC